MTTPTASELTRLRRKIGDTDAAITASILEDIWDEAAGDESTAVVLSIQMLLSDAARFNDYTAGQTSEKKQQVYDNLKDLLTYWEDKAGVTSSIRIVGLRSVPPIWKELPAGEDHPDEKNRRHNDAYPYRRRWRIFGGY